MTWRSSVAAGLVAAVAMDAASQQSVSLAILNVSVVPMDRDRVLAGQTVVVADDSRRAGVLVHGRWFAEADLQRRMQIPVNRRASRQTERPHKRERGGKTIDGRAEVRPN